MRSIMICDLVKDGSERRDQRLAAIQAAREPKERRVARRAAPLDKTPRALVSLGRHRKEFGEGGHQQRGGCRRRRCCCRGRQCGRWHIGRLRSGLGERSLARRLLQGVHSKEVRGDAK